MPKNQRQKLIERKYVSKYWIPRSGKWEMEMQKKYPLAPDELAVLDYINVGKYPTNGVPPTASNPRKFDSGWGWSKSQPGETREPRRISPEARWSNEIVCNGHRVMMLKTHNSRSSPGLSLSRPEKVINDGRMEKRADPIELYDYLAKCRARLLGGRDRGECECVLEGENEPLGIKVLEPVRVERRETTCKERSFGDLIDLAGTDLGESEMEGTKEGIADLLDFGID